MKMYKNNNNESFKFEAQMGWNHGMNHNKMDQLLFIDQFVKKKKD